MGHFSVGLCVVNALSSRLTAEVRCGGVRRVQEHARGVALAPPAAVGPARTSGTTVAFWPDAEIFETTRCSFAVLAERFRQIAFLNLGLEISLTDERRAAGTMEVALMWGGSREERLRSFANSRLTREGGTHVDGFHDGVAAAVTAWARGRGLLTAQDAGPGADRIGEGLTAVVSVKLDPPRPH
ncbi:hypothetical protein [Streptomyces sp. NPDC002566]|uniref:hypothetical protein n=1 Tax=Streptomyces sp. NPDC002566 TaxID=3364650 RepID=UPI003692CE24